MKKVKLITETSHDIDISESKKDKSFYITGIFSSAERKNNNNRIYSRDILKREIGKVSEKVDNRCLWGELSHPSNAEINPDRIAILTEALEWRGNDLYGKAKVLDTPMGQILKTLVKEGKMGISSRGLGTVDENSGYVNEDFNLITWDVVVDPSNQPSWVNGIYEGKEFVVYEFDKEDEKEDEKITEEEKKKAQEEYAKYLIEFIDNLCKKI